MTDRIKRRLREILSTHKAPPLPDGAVEQIEAIISAA